MGIFTELSILYSKYKPEKRKSASTSHNSILTLLLQSWST